MPSHAVTSHGVAPALPARRRGRHRADRPTRVLDARLAAAVTVAAGTVGSVLAAPAALAQPAAPATGSTSSGSAPSDSTPAARAAHAEAQVPGTPCSVSARACVDLESHRMWLIDGGRVVRGPMAVTTGGRGAETPIGHSFRVYRHDADHVSEESRLPDGRPAPMPWSTFFADGGVAFHGGKLNRASAGCVHLSMADAKAVYDFLEQGDKVQVVKASDEKAARRAHA